MKGPRDPKDPIVMTMGTMKKEVEMAKEEAKEVNVAREAKVERKTIVAKREKGAKEVKEAKMAKEAKVERKTRMEKMEKEVKEVKNSNSHFFPNSQI